MAKRGWEEDLSFFFSPKLPHPTWKALTQTKSQEMKFRDCMIVCLA